MAQRPQNNRLRVNKNGKYIRKSIFHHLNAVPQPQVQVYIIHKKDFKSIVQQLTSPNSSERCLTQSQDPPNHHHTSSVPPSAMAAQEDPDVSLYMRYLQSILEEDSSGSHGDQFQQSLDHEYQSHMQTQAYSQPQAPIHHMSQSNVMMPDTLCSSWFNGSPQQMNDAYSLQSTRIEYPHPPAPNLMFSCMAQPGVLGPDLGRY